MAKKKTGSIQKRGSTYRISYYSDGIRNFETIKGTLEEAQNTLNIRLGEISKGLSVSSKPNTVRFDELAADVLNDYKVAKYSSYEDIDARFRLHILPFFGRRKASQITTANIKAYIVKRRADTPTPKEGTIKHELEAINRTFNLALEERRIHTKPHIPTLEANNVRTGFFTRAEVDRLVSHMTPTIGQFTLFGFLTGWRFEEIRGLEWRHVDFAASEIRLDPGTTKNGDGRVFPMNAELRALLNAILAARSAPLGIKPVIVMLPRVPAQFTKYVFTVRGRQVGSFRKQWYRANLKAGLPCILNTEGKLIKAVRIFHDLRRSAAREFQRQGFTEGQIMLMMGHRTRSMFDRYQIVTLDDIRETMRRLDGAKDGAKPNEA